MCPVMLEKVGFCDTSDQDSDVNGKWTWNMSLGLCIAITRMEHSV
jgi:hypothetical protein